jgi:hypothetical protein
MSGTNRLVVSTLGKGSESALTAGLMNANEVVAKDEKKEGVKKEKAKKK